jgi:pyruvate kinase
MESEEGGKRKFKVESVTDNAVITRVIAGGNIRSNGGVNIIDAQLTIPVLTERDMKDIDFGVKAGVDLFAISFVKKAEDVSLLKNILSERGSTARIISKIETPEALEVIDSIIDISDGVMVARGDLAIEIGHEYVPKAQKMIIKKCNEKNKLVIVATDMMDSMKSNPVPTRAEVSDVANAILDGADAVMTSIETVIGDYPIETVTMMRKIIDVYKK